MKKLLLVAMTLCTLASCAPKQEDLMSPCVGAKGSPCDRRAPAEQNAHEKV